MGDYSSFIVRLWVERERGWRWGWIQHVATQEKRRFTDVAEMLDFISRHSQVQDEVFSLSFELEEAPDSAPTEAQATGRAENSGPGDDQAAAENQR